jgi:hypothetical protein
VTGFVLNCAVLALVMLEFRCWCVRCAIGLMLCCWVFTAAVRRG